MKTLVEVRKEILDKILLFDGSTAELARRAQIHKQTLYAISEGKQDLLEVSFKKIYVLSKVLGVEL